MIASPERSVVALYSITDITALVVVLSQRLISLWLKRKNILVDQIIKELYTCLPVGRNIYLLEYLYLLDFLLIKEVRPKR